jgi:hypothetical protein
VRQAELALQRFGEQVAAGRQITPEDRRATMLMLVTLDPMLTRATTLERGRS